MFMRSRHTQSSPAANSARKDRSASSTTLRSEKRSQLRRQLQPEGLEERMLLAADTVLFDPTPDGDTSDAFEYSSLDFLPGNALITNYDELLNDPSASGDLLFQAKLNSFIDANGASLPVDPSYELTLVARFSVQLDGTTVKLANAQSGDSFGATLYYDDSPDATELAGTGFDNGTPVFNVDITSLNPTSAPPSTVVANLIPGVDLDGFGANNFPGVETAFVGGIINALGDPNAVNAAGDFLYDPGTMSLLADSSFDIFRWNTTLTAPFQQQQPSRQFFGANEASYDAEAGIGTVNGDGVAGDNGDDLLMQADSNASFEYQTSSIHGFKFEDANKDGIYTPPADLLNPLPSEDRPFSDITFKLYLDGNNDGIIELDPNSNGVVDDGEDAYVDVTAQGQFIEFTTTEGAGVVTDADGEFWFTDLCSGHYIVAEMLMDPDVMPSTSDQYEFTVEAGTQYVWQANAASSGVVTGRQLFYNNSSYDGNDPNADAASDVNAVDPLKTAFLGVGQATGTNTSGYTRGINGIRVDIDNAALDGMGDPTLTLSDFVFLVGNDQDTANWTPISATGLSTNVNGTTVEAYITFADNEIVDESLKVIVKSSPNTKLPLDDIHYWTHLAGQAVDSPGVVDFLDLSAVSGDFDTPANLEDNNDLNKDGHVDFLDLSAVSGNFDDSVVMLDADSPEWTQCDKETAFNEEITPGLIFGNFVKGSIHGFKFNDFHGDGVYDPNDWDKPMGGVDFELTGTDGMGNDITPIVVTSDETGNFWFTDLMPGTYVVTELPTDPDVIPTTDLASEPIVIYSGQEYAWKEGAAMIPDGSLKEEVVANGDQDDYDDLDANLIWGNTILGSIHGLKFEDYNGNGVYEPDVDLNGVLDGDQVDTPWSGFEFQLWEDVNGDGLLDGGDVLVGGPLLSGDTNEDGIINYDDTDMIPDDDPADAGAFWFTGLYPGNYLVQETGNYSLDDNGDAVVVPKTPELVSVYVGSGQELVWELGAADLPDGSLKDEKLMENLVFGNSVLGSVHGFKCEDFDADGICSTLISGDNPHVVFAIDTSGSVGSSSGFDVDGDMVNDSILEVEKEAIRLLVAQLDATYGANAFVSVIAFTGSATALDMDPDAAGQQDFVSADILNAGGTTGIDAIINGLSAGGGTSFAPAVTTATTLLTTAAVGAENGNFVILSDGDGGSADAEADILAGVANNIRGVGIGAGANLSGLQQIDDADGSDDAIKFEMAGDLLDFFSGSGGSGTSGTAFAGIPFSIYDSGANNVTPGPDGYVLTDDNGEFWFEGLMPGEYTVTERVDLLGTLYPNDSVMASGPVSYTLFVGSREEHVWRTGAAGLEDNDLRYEVGPDENLVFENYVKGSIHGFKFHDVDQDGVYDPSAGDTPFEGVVFELYSDLNDDGIYETYHQLDEGFEGGAIPAGWSTDGIDPDGTIDADDLWDVTGSAVGPLDGSFSAHAGFGLENSESSWLDYDGLSGPGIIYFDYAVDSEADFDFLSFQVDSGSGYTTLDSWSGSEAGSAWFLLPSGEHDLRWRYDKDFIFSDGVDSAFIDNVTFFSTSDENGEFWFTDLIPGDYFVAEYPDAFTSNFDGEVMSTTHTGDGTFDDALLGEAVVQEVTILSRQELVWAPGAAMLPGDNDGDGIVDDNDANSDGLPDVLREEVLTEELAFGNYVKGSIHGFKFEDYDADGLYEPNVDSDPTLAGDQFDTPWAGFEFQLWTDNDGDGIIDQSGDDAGTTDVDESLDDDTLVGSQLSDINGEFWFTNVEPGTYVLVETELFDPNGDDVSDEAGDEIKASTSLTRALTVGSGQELVWQDGAANLDPITTPSVKEEVNVGTELMFGNYVEGSIHAFKFEDYDGDGVYDLNAGDQSMGSVAFILTKTDEFGTPIDEDSDTIPDFQVTTTSNAEGMLWFNDLAPGWYSLEEDLSATAGGAIMTQTTVHELIFVGSRHEMAFKPGAAMLDPTSGTLKEEILDTNDANDYIVSGELHDANLMYGNAVNGSIHGFKFHDVDGDGVFDGTGRAVYVIDASGSMSAIGNFGGVPTPDIDGDGNSITKLDLELNVLNDALGDLEAYLATLSQNNDFEVSVVVMQNGVAYSVDLDSVTPGLQAFASPDDALITNVVGEIVANGSFSSAASGNSDLQGGIDLAATLLAGVGADAHTSNVYFFSDGYDNINNGPIDASVLDSLASNVQAFGVGPDENLTALQIFDPDATTVITDFFTGFSAVSPSSQPEFNGPELPLAGISFELTGIDGLGNPITPVTVQTDSDGEFWFTGLQPGNYTVTELPNLDYPATSTGFTWTQDIGSREEYAWGPGQAELWAGIQVEVVDPGLIFGNYTPVNIDVFKFDDYDGNGIYDSGIDSPMPGITFELYDSDGFLVATGISNLAGNVVDGLGQPAFANLAPDTYTVVEVDDPTDDIIPTTPTSVTTTLYSGDSDSLEFGNTILGSFHGFKFHDVNADGVYDRFVDADNDTVNDFDLDVLAPGEQYDTPWSGATFVIMDSNFAIVGSTTTGSDGAINFDDLMPGTYTIVEVDDPTDNVHPTSAPNSVTVTIGSGEELVWEAGAANLAPHAPQVEVLDDSLIFGNWIEGSLHGCVFHDDGDGFYTPGNDSIQGGVLVELYDSAGNLVDSMVTSTVGATRGLFWFEGLRPDDYDIRVPESQGGAMVIESDIDYAAPNYAEITVTSGNEYVHQAGAASLEANQTEVVVPSGGPTDLLNLGVDIQQIPAIAPGFGGGSQDDNIDTGVDLEPAPLPGESELEPLVASLAMRQVADSPFALDDLGQDDEEEDLLDLLAFERTDVRS